MKRLKKENEWIGTILAFMIIPISGFAIDVYVPSFPQMVNDLHATPSDIRLTLSIFLISYGVSQLFVGSIVDSFGRYKIALVSLLVFVLSNLAIVITKSIEVIFVMRALQGLVISLIMVAKRTLFIDIYTGDKRKKYTSLLSVVWSTAPVVAPFVGGYLQSFIGWEANFYFLALYGAVMLVLELIYSGETIAAYKPFHLKTILNTYREFLSAKDFSIGVLVLGLSYSMVIIFGMSAPFIIEHVFHYSPVITGYASLCSGVSLLTGGMLSRMLIDKPFHKKLKLGNLVQFGIALLMFMFDLVVFLYIPHHIRMQRLHNRELERYGDAIFTDPERAANYQVFIKWATGYDDNTTKGRTLQVHENWLSQVNSPILEIRGDTTVQQRVELVLEKIKEL